ncbi:MAG: glycosyltransferase family A protein [Planctomycetota bacterium]
MPDHAPPTADNRAGPRPGRRYALVTPCRDEEDFASATIASVADQTEPPAVWIIIDDGSTDRTPAILEHWASRIPFIKVVRREKRENNGRRVGAGVIEAFDEGLTHVDMDGVDFVCKFDLDLKMRPGYFAAVMDEMERDPRLAVFSGKPYFKHRDALGRERMVSEMCGDENAVGMAKFYRVDAFRDIGGFVQELMWDGIDGHMCRMRGWRAQSHDHDEALEFEHLRPMGTSHRGWWTGRSRHGRGQHFMGTGLLYMLASATFRLTRPPLIVGGLAMMSGYLWSALRGRKRFDQRYDRPDFRRFLRRYQRLSLLHGKAAATRKIDQEQAAAFESRHETPPAKRLSKKSSSSDSLLATPATS